MLIEVAVGVRQRMRSAPILPSLVSPFVGHEAIRMALQLGANARMRREVTIEPRMVRAKLRIVHQPRVVGQLACDFRMLVEIAASNRDTSPPVMPALGAGYCAIAAEPNAPVNIKAAVKVVIARFMAVLLPIGLRCFGYVCPGCVLDGRRQWRAANSRIPVPPARWPTLDTTLAVVRHAWLL